MTTTTSDHNVMVDNSASDISTTNDTLITQVTTQKAGGWTSLSYDNTNYVGTTVSTVDTANATTSPTVPLCCTPAPRFVQLLPFHWAM